MSPSPIEQRQDSALTIARLTAELAAARSAIARLEQLFDLAPIGIISYDTDAQVTFVNRRALESTGLADLEQFAELVTSLVHPDDQAALSAAVGACRTGRPGEFQVRMRRTSGDWIHVAGTMVPIFQNGVMSGAVSLYGDMTREVEQGNELRWFKAIADQTTDIVGISSPTGDLTYLNPAGRRLLDVAPDEPIQLSAILRNVPGEVGNLLPEGALDAVMRGEVWQGDLALRVGNAEANHPVSAVVVGVRDGRDELVALAATFRDLSERKKLEAQLTHAAAHDPLTGLVGRQELFRALDDSIAGGEGVAVLFLDLDDFKVVNDSLGHAVGDQVLSELASRIRSAARQSDVVGRLGGDEFLVICRGVSTADEASEIANRILTSVRQPMEIGSRQHLVTGSIGIAVTGGASHSAAALVQEADIAMYRAKRSGRRRSVVFSDSMRVEAIDRLELEADLRRALTDQEFELYFQPRVQFGDATVTNFEALIRWNHPRFGVLRPAEFLSVVDKIGLTPAVGEWVLGAAISAVKAMRTAAPDVCVGVNVDAEHLRQNGFVAGVVESVRNAGLPGDALIIEITEQALMADADQTHRVLEQLNEFGVNLAIDDFGTGYSSLDLLRRLPVNFLKIDERFVAGLGIEADDTQLVRLILGLASELGIDVVAEGVETSEQAQELQRLGCRSGQGYLFSPPLNFEGAMALLRSQLEPVI
jgi:diguanylate cyclase (GGDEF)-like protein/PAS domain S-box-containing protein